MDGRWIEVCRRELRRICLRSVRRPEFAGRSRVRRLLRAAGIKLFFLPPYSPDLNPIEQVFSKLKRLLRRANERTVGATWRRIGSLLGRFSPAECANYISGAGYASI